MKKMIFPAILLLALASCSKSARDTVGEQNKTLVQKYVDAIVKGDTSNLESFLAAQFMGYGPAMKDSSDRQKEIDSFKKNWRDSWSSVKFDRAAIVAFTLPPGEKNPGDWVADWATITVNYKNAAPPVTFNWHGVSRVKDGKIERIFAFYDVNDILIQQGFTVTPPASKSVKPKEAKKKALTKKEAKEAKKKAAKKK
jgi:hypothetical protein